MTTNQNMTATLNNFPRWLSFLQERQNYKVISSLIILARNFWNVILPFNDKFGPFHVFQKSVYNYVGSLIGERKMLWFLPSVSLTREEQWNLQQQIEVSR